jgi:tRNA-dihydrouridine synthase B
MAGISDEPMRRLAQSFGARIPAPSEMVSSKAQTLLSGGGNLSPRAARMFRKAFGRGPNIVQIFGSDPAVMAESARINEALGADMIDINMGCPAPKIIKGNGGAMLMRMPELASDIIRAVALAVKIPASVKIRTGWDPAHRNAPEFARMAEESGAKMIAIHGRTRAQMYSGSVDFKTIAAVKRAVKIPVVGNGDITDAASAARMIADCGVDGVMIGRAAIGAPWLPAHIALALKGEKPLPPDRAKTAISHLDMMRESYGDKTGLINFRKHLAGYSRGIKAGADFRRMANAEADYGKLVRLIREWL